MTGFNPIGDPLKFSIETLEPKKPVKSLFNNKFENGNLMLGRSNETDSQHLAPSTACAFVMGDLSLYFRLISVELI